MNSSTAFDQPSSLSAAEPGPSFLKNSCTGQGTLFCEHKQEEEGFSSINKSSREGLGPAPDLVCIDTSKETSRTIDLKDLPMFTEQNLNRKLISNAETMPDKIAPKAHRHKMEGYKLWKEGYVSNMKVKPNVSAGGFKLFIVKSSVSASMKSIKYTVYVHLNMDSSDVTHAKCNCKAGQGGCCKHVAAALYTILDFSNLNLRYVPEEVTCTQVLQNWSVPNRKITSRDAVKFSDLEFQKADFEKDRSKKRRKLMVTGNREGFCATSPYARQVKSSELEKFANTLRRAGKATLLVQTLTGHNFEPCDRFVTSCVVAQKSSESVEAVKVDYFDSNFIFNLMPNKIVF